VRAWTPSVFIRAIRRSLTPRSLKRRALTKPNLAYLRWRYISNRERTFSAWWHQPAYANSPRVAEELRERGIVAGPSDQYLDQEGRKALVEASALVLGISHCDDVQARINGFSDDRKDYCIRLIRSEQEHAPNSPLLRLALDRKLLEIVSLYLGMWPRLNLISAWLNYPTADALKESQLWHRDPEDIKIVKAFIYLVDVDDDCGAFCYIPKTHPFGSRAAIVPKHVDPNRVTDSEMRAAIPAGSWMTYTGPAKTMILADTVGYHRGGKPIIGKRILITFTYTSGTPIIKRAINITGEPSWITHAIQHYALD
jgi:hypothetical protein